MSEIIRNIAGCIPIENKTLFDFVWHDCFLPVGDNTTALERSIYDCAYAGCNSIWITCPYDILPIIKKAIGDFVADPVYRVEIFENYNIRRIPVYYVPLRALDYDRHSSLGWAAINSAMWAKKVTAKFSKYLVPKKFFVSLPYGLHDPKIFRNYRAMIANKTNVVFENNNENIFSSAYLPFTFDIEDFDEILFNAKKKIKKRFDKYTYISVGEQIFARDLEISDFFECLYQKEHCTLSTPWYYKVDSWEGYREYTASDRTLELEKLQTGKVDKFNAEETED
jgi:hypothetical protein